MRNVSASTAGYSLPSHGLDQAAVDFSDPAARRNELRQQMRERARAVPNPAAVQSGGRLSRMMHAGRNRAVGEALTHAREFYDIRLNNRTNAQIIGMDDRQVARNPPDTVTGLKRKASFLSIARQAEDVGTLLQQDGAGRGPKLDGNARAALEAALHTVRFNAKEVQLRAVENARLGKRAQPLALDHARFVQFLANREAVLESVISACSSPATAATRLEPILQKFAEDYLRENNMLPTGMRITDPLGPGIDLHPGQVAKPITIVFGHGEGSQDKHFQSTRDADMAAIVLHPKLLQQPLQNYSKRLARFSDLDQARQRAALVMQVLIGALVSTEESIAGGLRNVTHAPTAAAREQARGTRAEIDYAGAPAIGDACEASALAGSQRAAVLMPVSQLPLRAQAYQTVHREPMLNDRVLRDWMTGPQFDDDSNAARAPAARLRLAQAPTTAELLRRTRAFS